MDIIAHRGASTYAPENTLAAFQKALDTNATGIEFDVQLTKDGVPVICHDAKINRTSNGKGYISDLTLAQLKDFNFHGKFKKNFSSEKIPTLEEVLQLVSIHSITLNIELKNGPFMPNDLEEKVLFLVEKYNCQDKVIYSSFDHQSIKRLAKLKPDARIGLIFHINLINLFDYLDNTGLNLYSIHPNYFYVTEEMVRDAKKRNLKIFAYTINEPETALHYKELGIDGIITNDPLLFE